MNPTINRRRLNSAETATHQVLHLRIDKKKIRLVPVSLLDENLVHELSGLIAAATAVSITSWASVLSLPKDAQNNLLRLLSVGGPQYAIRIVGNRTIYHDVFAATLALTVEATDLRQVAEVTDLAITAAAQCHPGAIRPAAEQIKTWLAQNRIAADRTDVIAGRIRQQAGPANQAGQLTPQQAADLVLAEWQCQREQRGDDTSTSPPVWLWNGDRYRWVGTHWRTAPDLDHEIVRILQRSTDRELTTAFIAATRMNLDAKIVLVTDGVRLPVYVHDANHCEHRDTIAFENGVIDLQQMARTGRLPELQPHDPQLFAISCLPYAYDPEAECPLWIETINSILQRREPGDHRIAILQEFMGYCVMPWDMTQEAFTVLVGHGANGKNSSKNYSVFFGRGRIV